MIRASSPSRFSSPTTTRAWRSFGTRSASPSRRTSISAPESAGSSWRRPGAAGRGSCWRFPATSGSARGSAIRPADGSVTSFSPTDFREGLCRDARARSDVSRSAAQRALRNGRGLRRPVGRQVGSAPAAGVTETRRVPHREHRTSNPVLGRPVRGPRLSSCMCSARPSRPSPPASRSAIFSTRSSASWRSSASTGSARR